MLAAVILFSIVTPTFASEFDLGSKEGTFPSLSAPTTANPVISSTATQLDSSQLPTNQLNEHSPIAPLPPALVAGPIGIMVASWMAHRANRRGGKL